MKKQNKIVFLCQANREQLLKKDNKALPDTILFGLNRLKKYNIIFTGWPKSFIGRIIAHFSFPFYAILTSIKYINSDLIIVQDPFWILGLLRKLKILPPTIFLNISIYATFQKSNNLIKKILTFAVNGFDLTILLRKKYPPFYNSFKGETYFLPLGIDVEFYRLDKKYKQEDFILSLGGSKKGANDYDAIIKFAKGIKNKIILVTPKGEVKSKLPNNIELKESIPRLEVRELYRKCFCGIILFKKDSTNQFYGGQTTILELLSHNKPIITNYQEWITDYDLNKNPNVIIVNNTSEAINALKKIKKHNSRELIEKKFSTKKVALEMEQLIDKFMSNN